MSTDTICAPATASGGALAVIRISGPRTFDAVKFICRCDLARKPANTVNYTHITDPSQGELIDEVLLSVFRSPHSYTGEDSVEIACHGSRYIVQRILDLLVQNGCRMAYPGEFTQRAFLNGKLDLSQAEAVADLIASTNKATHQMAISQMKGQFSSELKKLREQLLRLTSLLELELDFSDHEDLEFADRDELKELAQKIDHRIGELAQSFEMGQALKQGIPVAIVGKTNVGKSTLLNHLIGDNRAIVSDVHGTTRDTIEEAMDIHGVQFRFIDTAGIRKTTDAVEQIGIDRTYATIEKARIILWLFDQPPTKDEEANLQRHIEGTQALLPIHTKSDLGPIDYSCVAPLTIIPISAKTSVGLDQLKERIYEAANIQGLSGNEVIVTSTRHYDALCRSRTSIQQVLSGLHSNLTGDLLAEDLRQAIDILSEITGGQITPKETLNSIFSNFCVGK